MKTAKVGTPNDTRFTRLTRILLFAVLSAVALAQPLRAATLTPASPIELTGTHGKFDFIKVDEARGRLLACHTGNGSLDVIDESTSKLIKSIPTGAAQGVAIDDKGGRYFVSCSKPPQLVVIDAEKLEATGTVSLPGPADVCTYNPALNRVVVDNDDKPEQWTIDPDAKKIVQTLAYPGPGMEDLAFNDDGTFLVQNLKDENLLAVVDSAKNSLVHQWPTAPAEKPHGLALVNNGKEAVIAGGNGKLAILDYKTGKVTGSADIAPRVDEIAYDPDRKMVYGASGTGVISVVAWTGFWQNIGSVPSSPGAHSIAVDRKTHIVWIVFAKGDKAYVQRFDPGTFSNG